MSPRVTKIKKFPCECGKSFDTSQEFSDHVHKDCKEGIVPWGTVEPQESK